MSEEKRNRLSHGQLIQATAWVVAQDKPMQSDEWLAELNKRFSNAGEATWTKTYQVTALLKGCGKSELLISNRRGGANVSKNKLCSLARVLVSIIEVNDLKVSDADMSLLKRIVSHRKFVAPEQQDLPLAEQGDSESPDA